MDNYLNVANSWMLWLATMPVAGMVIIQAVIFSKRAKKAAPLVGLTEQEARKAFRVGMTSAIGPAMGVFAVMLGLMGVIGGPLAWMRLSIIGAAPTELAAAQMAAKAQGLELTSPNYGLINFANATWVMALNGSAWLFVSGAFSDKLDLLTQKVAKGDPKKLGILMIAAMCGAFSYLFASQLVNVVKPEMMPYVVATIVGAIAMIVFESLGDKYPKLKEWSLGLAMFIAMACAEIYKVMVIGG